MDILENRIYPYDPAVGDIDTWRTPEQFGFVLVRVGAAVCSEVGAAGPAVPEARA